MRAIFFLWLLHISSVTSLKLLPFTTWELSSPHFGTQTRLYGETRAMEKEFPFMILILYETKEKAKGICSASLLLSDWVLTAAHCFQNNDTEIPLRNVILVGGKANLGDYAEERTRTDWEVNLNETKFQVEERRARTIYIHPEYKFSEDEILHDIALIKVEKPFTITEYISTIRLNLDKINSSRICTLLGWGTTPTKMNYQLNVVREKEISTTSIGCNYVMDQPLICLKSDGLSGICKGDSGSPLVCDGEVFGVASYMLSSSLNCGDSLEEYYTDLSNEKDWIISTLNAGSRTVGVDFTRAFTLLLIALWIISPNTLY